MRKMSAAAAAAVVAVCLGGAALAGDSAQSGFNWSGFYAGGQIGYSWTTADHDARWSKSETYNMSNKIDGLAGGLYAGINFHQPRNVVLGIEADVTWRDQPDRAKEIYAYGYPTGGTSHAEVDWSVGVRGRIGYAIDRVLPYLAVGVAAQNGRFGYGWDVSGNKDGNFSRDTLVGLTLGAGVDYAIRDNLIARIDYRYGTFDKKTVYVGGNPDAPAKIDMDTHDLFFGVAYKF